MATAEQHRARWHHNRAFLATIKDAYADWMVVVMFYSVLHAVEAVFVHHGIRVHGGHEARNQTLKRYNRYKEIWRHYRPLYDAARTARYEADAGEWMPVDKVKGELAKHFYGLERSVARLLGAGNPPPHLWT